jgi:hypothetical protein
MKDIRNNLAKKVDQDDYLDSNIVTKDDIKSTEVGDYPVYTGTSKNHTEYTKIQK